MVRTAASVLAKVASFTGALINGKYVDDETYDARVKACDGCEHRNGALCGICNCNITGIKAPLIKEITALARYVENLPQYGCKHPHRGKTNHATGQKFGWPKESA
jgi:hypothetical protein